MKRLFAIFLMLVLLGVSGCQKVLPDEPIPDEPGKLLEFPGLQWNMRPSEVKKALSLREGDLLELSKEDSIDMLSTDYYLIPVKGEALGELFGGKVKYAYFYCYDNHTGENKGNYGLGLIRVLYEDDTDMTAVRQAVADRYGEETPSTSFGWYPYPGGNATSSVLDMEEYEKKKDTYVLTPQVRKSTEHSFYWGSEKMQGDYVTGAIKDAYLDAYKKGNIYEQAENFLEGFETMLQETNAVTISVRDGAPSETWMQEDGTPAPTSKSLVFDARQLTYPCRRLATGWSQFHK